jgi:hypothetical protein
VVVMGLEAPPVAVEVEWPGGKKTRVAVGQESLKISVSGLK